MAKKSNLLKTTSSAELLSYIINSDPVLSANINLPVQGQSIKPIGKLIVSNERYKNAFLNAINLIAVTLVTRNSWSNPWEEFTEQGSIDFGQSVREMIVDIAKSHDYNATSNSPTHFLEQEVPNVLEYIHDINFQKYYKVTVSDEQISMAFTNESNMYDLIQECYNSLYEGYKYDKFIVDKYQLCRRIVDGTIPSAVISDFATNTPRQNVAIMKGYSNKLTFRKPNYNPAGLRLATPFDEQRTIINTEFDGQVTTEVLATSYFRNDAEMKTKLGLIDSFSDHDTERLTECLGDAYVPFTDDEQTVLSNVVGMIISDDFFKDYYYSLDTQAESVGATKTTEFYNPETLKNTMWLHVWRIFSTSPFTNAIVFTKTASAVSSVTISPDSATITKGQKLQFSATVATTGVTNKAVTWKVDSTSASAGVTINEYGLLYVPSDSSASSITVTATSVYDTTKYDTATVTIATGVLPSITSVTVSATADSVAKDSTLQFSATVVKTGNASEVVTWAVDSSAEADGISVSSSGLLTVPSTATVEEVTVTATSVFDDTKSGSKKVTVTGS